MCEAVCSCQGSVMHPFIRQCKYKSNHCLAGPGGFPGGFPGGAGAGPGMAGLGELLKDPELLNAMKVTNSVLHITAVPWLGLVILTCNTVLRRVL